MSVSIQCPRCNQIVYACCSAKTCVCHKDIPIKNILVYKMLLFGKIVLPQKFGNWLWDKLCKIKFISPWKRQHIIVEIRECPFCKYRMLYFMWDDLYEQDEYQEYKTIKKKYIEDISKIDKKNET